jgi:hypothetical protein
MVDQGVRFPQGRALFSFDSRLAVVYTAFTVSKSNHLDLLSGTGRRKNLAIMLFAEILESSATALKVPRANKGGCVRHAFF